MGPEVATAIADVGTSMAGLDIGMIAPTALVSALIAIGFAKPTIDRILAQVKAKSDEMTGKLPPENY